MPRFAANLTMLFNEVPFLDRFALAAKAGFEGVEYLFPYDFDAAGAEALRLEANGLTQVLHNLPAGDWAAGERGIAILPDRIDEFRRGVVTAIDYATALGCTQVNCLAGIAPAGVDPMTCCGPPSSPICRLAADELAEHGIRLLIEPINTLRHSGLLSQHGRAGGSIIDEVGSDNLFIQYDLYHQQRTRGRTRRHLSSSTRTGSPISSSPTIPAATSRARARSTIPSSSRQLDRSRLRRLDRLRIQAEGTTTREGPRLAVRRASRAAMQRGHHQDEELSTWRRSVLSVSASWARPWRATCRRPGTSCRHVEVRHPAAAGTDRQGPDRLPRRRRRWPRRPTSSS